MELMAHLPISAELATLKRFASEDEVASLFDFLGISV
jgi:hypothetical protein